MHAYGLGRRKLIVFDDVDVYTALERTTAEGEKVVKAYILRAADKKTCQEINREMQEAQSRPADKVASRQVPVVTDIGMALPEFLRRFLVYIFGNPHRWRQSSTRPARVSTALSSSSFSVYLLRV